MTKRQHIEIIMLICTYLSNVSYHSRETRRVSRLSRRASHLERRASRLVKRENNELSAWFRLARQIHRTICMYGIHYSSLVAAIEYFS